MITDVLTDENCTELGDYCINVHCSYQNTGNAPGMFRVRGLLRDRDGGRVVANYYSSLTLLVGATQRVTFRMREAELDRRYEPLCQVDHPSAAANGQ
jgi:hypothetical protein